MQTSHIVGVQLAVLSGIRGEGIHSGVVNLQTAIGCNPQITDLIRTKGIHMVVNQGSHAVLGQRIDGSVAILQTRQTITLGTDPEAAVGGKGHGRHLLTGNGTIIADQTIVAGTI